MLKSVLMYLVPFVLTLAVAGAIRFFGGAERGARAAGVAITVGFIAGLAIFKRPEVFPTSDFARISHIALGAALVALVLDLLAPRRFWVATAALVVIVVSAWGSVNGGLRPYGALNFVTTAIVIGLSLGAFLILARLDAARERGVTVAMLLLVAAFGLAAMAALVGDKPLAVASAMLGIGIAAFAVMQGAVALPAGNGLILGAGSTVLALAWALAHGRPETRLGLILVPLIFFAEGTAQRVPLPKARISMLLYPLILALVAALPLVLAVIVVYVTVSA